MSDHRPKISVGMPVYNGERYLEYALQSLLGQSFDDFELVISDNASTDGTGEICGEYARRDERIAVRADLERLGGGRLILERGGSERDDENESPHHTLIVRRSLTAHAADKDPVPDRC